MGIPIVPPEKIPEEDECSTCFGPGLTPDWLIVHLAGIIRGPNWYEELGPPPNGLHLITHDYGCQWSGESGTWTIRYKVSGGATELLIWHTIMYDAVRGVSDEECASWLQLFGRPVPPSMWQEGVALITMTADCPIISLSSLAESVGLTPGADLLGDPFVVPDEQAVIRYARKRDATNIKIKIDCS